MIIQSKIKQISNQRISIQRSNQPMSQWERGKGGDEEPDAEPSEEQERHDEADEKGQ